MLDLVHTHATGGPVPIYTSFIGIGVDFNSAFAKKMTQTRGANYYSVHSGRLLAASDLVACLTTHIRIGTRTISP